MSDLPVNGDIVTIDGKQYNRLMAEEMARDIELAHSIRPGVWAIGMNTSLIVGNMAFLSFGLPIQHGFLIDTTDTSVEIQELVSKYGNDPEFKDAPSLRFLRLPTEGLSHFLNILRPAHEPVVSRYSRGFFTKCQRWKWHSFENGQMLSRIVGRDLPEPSYAEELRALRELADGMPTPVHRKFWKISPGPLGKYWDTFRDQSLIAVHWSDENADLSDYPANHAEFIGRAKSELGVSDQGARSLWDFSKVMQPNDKVLAYANQSVLGFGSVESDYELIDDDFEYMHRRSVDWLSTEIQPISRLSPSLQAKLKTQATLFELTSEQFAEATGEKSRNLPPLVLSHI